MSKPLNEFGGWLSFFKLSIIAGVFCLTFKLVFIFWVMMVGPKHLVNHQTGVFLILMVKVLVLATALLLQLHLLAWGDPPKRGLFEGGDLLFFRMPSCRGG